MRWAPLLSERRTCWRRGDALAGRRRACRPIRPVRTSSLIPCGRTSSSNDSISSAEPTISKTSASGPRSTTRALKTSASAISSARRSGGAATLISAQLALDRLVRARAPSTRRTLTSLCICFSICSSVCCSQSTRSVIARDVLALGRADGEALDVVAAPREHARDPHQRTRLVLDEDGQRVDHRRPPPSPPRGTRPDRARPRRRGSSGSSARAGRPGSRRPRCGRSASASASDGLELVLRRRP